MTFIIGIKYYLIAFLLLFVYLKALNMTIHEAFKTFFEHQKSFESFEIHH